MDSSIFFHPAKERNFEKERRAATAKAVCQQCPAINDCLAHALKVREPYGIWGGLSEDERAQVLGLRSMRYPARSLQEPAEQPAGHSVESKNADGHA